MLSILEHIEDRLLEAEDMFNVLQLVNKAVSLRYNPNRLGLVPWQELISNAILKWRQIDMNEMVLNGGHQNGDAANEVIESRRVCTDAKFEREGTGIGASRLGTELTAGLATPHKKDEGGIADSGGQHGHQRLRETERSFVPMFSRNDFAN